MLISTHIAVSATLLSVRAWASCECGYVLPDTDAYFTNMIASNFADVADTHDPSSSAAFSAAWAVTDMGFGSPGNGALGRVYDPTNVWFQGGQLILRQRAYTPANAAAHDDVSCAAIISKGTFLYGSFRTVSRVTYDSTAQYKGSVAGWFFYADDNNEIDIETLGYNGTSAYQYTSQPSVGVSKNLPVPWTEFQEQRFDWTRTQASFYQNSAKQWTTTDNIPKVEGGMRLNLWANNNTYTGIPASTNVTTSVKAFLLYYNTTESNRGKDKTFNKACKDAGGKSSTTVCKSTSSSPDESLSSKSVETSEVPTLTSGALSVHVKLPTWIGLLQLAGLVSLLWWAITLAGTSGQ